MDACQSKRLFCIQLLSCVNRPCLPGPLAAGGKSKEQFVPPLVLPKLPSRVYVRFGQPISLEGVDKRDRDTCQRIYEDVKVDNVDSLSIFSLRNVFILVDDVIFFVF